MMLKFIFLQMMQGYITMSTQKYYSQKMINSDWAHRWLVKLSTKKCKSMSFHQRHYDTMTSSFTYKIDGVPSEHVESYKDLGVLFDPFLLFCLLYTSPSPRDRTRSRMPSSA